MGILVPYRKRSGWAGRVRPEGSAYHPDAVECVAIASAYCDNPCVEAVCTKFQRSKATVHRILATAGVRPYSGGTRFERRYSLNEAYFDEVATEEQAYWLGFFAADGCVYDNSSRIEIGLKAGDAAHLQKFADVLGSNAPLRYKVTDGHPVVVFSVRSRRIPEALARYGVGPRKSLTLDWPAALPSELDRHFIRGYFDGDGSWIVGGGQLRFLVVGTQPFLSEVRTRLFWSCCTSFAKIRQCKSKAYELKYGGNLQCLRIFRYLYAGSNMSLPRKGWVAAKALRLV